MILHVKFVDAQHTMLHVNKLTQHSEIILQRHFYYIVSFSLVKGSSDRIKKCVKINSVFKLTSTLVTSFHLNLWSGCNYPQRYLEDICRYYSLIHCQYYALLSWSKLRLGEGRVWGKRTKAKKELWGFLKPNHRLILVIFSIYY